MAAWFDVRAVGSNAKRRFKTKIPHTITLSLGVPRPDVGAENKPYFAPDPASTGVGKRTLPPAELHQAITMTQLEFLQGPITTRAKKLAAGTTADDKLTKLNEQLLSVK